MFVSTLNYENYLADLVLRLASKEKKINRSRHKTGLDLNFFLD